MTSVTFDRPEKANAFHPRQFDISRDFFYDIEHTPTVRCVLVRGNGKHFMAGGDLSTVVNFDKLEEGARTREGEVPIHRYNEMLRVMQRLSKPVIASVQGGVAGAGVGFVSA